MRAFHFDTHAYYHVYNRGVDKRKIFLSRNYYIRFIRTIRNILNTGSATVRAGKIQSLALTKTPHIPPVTFLVYALMPNHYHFLLRQDEDMGITTFMHKLDTSYTKFFDLNHKRSGHLFEYAFKAKQIESEEELVHVCRYIDLNATIARISKTPEKYEWSSYKDYIGKRNGTLCDKSIILSYFQYDPKKYESFVLDQIEYAKVLHLAKKEIENDEDSYYL